MTARREAGFTLLELLVAVALLGLLTVIAYGGVRFGSLSWTHAERNRTADADQAAIVRVLRQALANAYPGYASANPADPTVAFSGAAEQLTLLTPLPDAIEPGVMAVRRFRLAEDGTLVMDWRLDLPAADGESAPFRTTPLAGGIARLRFSYFGPSLNPLDPASWFDQWTGMRGLPELVRVQAWRRAEDAPFVRLVTATAITTNTECVYDPTDANCRRGR